MANDDIDSNYTDICSERTIFSNEKGFFGEMFDCIKSNCDAKWIENTFDSALSDMDKLKLLYEGPIVSDTLLGTLEHVTSVYRQKDAAFSLQRRTDGERLYEKAKSCPTTTTTVTQEDFKSALIFLTQAVLRAPVKGRLSDIPSRRIQPSVIVNRRHLMQNSIYIGFFEIIIIIIFPDLCIFFARHRFTVRRWIDVGAGILGAISRTAQTEPGCRCTH